MNRMMPARSSFVVVVEWPTKVAGSMSLTAPTVWSVSVDVSYAGIQPQTWRGRRRRRVGPGEGGVPREMSYMSPWLIRPPRAVNSLPVVDEYLETLWTMKGFPVGGAMSLSQFFPGGGERRPFGLRWKERRKLPLLSTLYGPTQPPPTRFPAPAAAFLRH